MINYKRRQVSVAAYLKMTLSEEGEEASESGTQNSVWRRWCMTKEGRREYRDAISRITADLGHSVQSDSEFESIFNGLYVYDESVGEIVSVQSLNVSVAHILQGPYRSGHSSIFRSSTSSRIARALFHRFGRVSEDCDPPVIIGGIYIGVKCPDGLGADFIYEPSSSITFHIPETYTCMSALLGTLTTVDTWKRAALRMSSGLHCHFYCPSVSADELMALKSLGTSEWGKFRLWDITKLTEDAGDELPSLRSLCKKCLLDKCHIHGIGGIVEPVKWEVHRLDLLRLAFRAQPISAAIAVGGPESERVDPPSALRMKGL
jgi:hypothetical protein